MGTSPTGSAEKAVSSREEILLKLRERIVRFAASRIRGDAAEDLAQDVLIVLHEKYAHLERLEDLLPLSLEIVRLKVLAYRRKAHRHGEYTQVPVEDVQLTDDGPDPLAAAEQTEMRERLIAASLPTRRALPQIDGSQAGWEEFRRDPGVARRGFRQHHLHLGFSLPQTSAGVDGRQLGKRQEMSAPMNSEEIRKLLGGYATNTLTDNERSALFEAALDDQDLFNALQDEQALKGLLADPASRQAIRQALERPVARARSAWWSRRWWSKRWIWGGAMAAVAATVFIVAVVHRRPSEPVKRVEIASNQQPANPEPAQAPLDQPAAKTVKKAPQAKTPNGRPINGRSHDLIQLVPQRANEQAAPVTTQGRHRPIHRTR